MKPANRKHRQIWKKHLEKTLWDSKMAEKSNESKKQGNKKAKIPVREFEAKNGSTDGRCD